MLTYAFILTSVTTSFAFSPTFLPLWVLAITVPVGLLLAYAIRRRKV